MIFAASRTSARFSFLFERTTGELLQERAASRFLLTRASCRMLLAIMLVALGAAPMTSAVQATDEVDRMIRQLGADRFDVRQAAHQRLLELGPEALPRLIDVASQGDLESRLRAARLVHRLRDAQYEALLHQLVSHPRRPAPEGLPAWNRYVAITGDGPDARRLYAGIFRSSPELLLMFASDDPELPQAAEIALGLLSNTMHRRDAGGIGFDRRGNADSGVPMAQAALQILIAVECETTNQRNVAAYLGSWLDNLGVKDGQQDDGELRVLNKIVEAWIQSHHTATRAQRMLLSRQFGYTSGVVPAREALLASDATLRERQEALLLLTRFGGVEHIPEIEAYLQNDSPLAIVQPGHETPRDTRLRDVALLALVHLTGQSPADYSLTSLVESSQTVYAIRSIGFASTDAREQAIAKWWAWRAIHLRSSKYAPLEAIEGFSL